MMAAKILVLCALLTVAFASSPYASIPSCNSAGWRDGSEPCVCNAGYSGANCESYVGACDSKFVVADPMYETHFPVLDMDPATAYLSHNNLHVSVWSPLVANRTFTNMIWTNQTEPRCSLGVTGSFWNKTVDATGCQDMMSLVMPWPSARDCGFRLFTTDLEYNHYKGNFGIEYEDMIGSVLGEQMMRKTSVHYDFFVSFPRMLNLELINNNVSIYATSGVTILFTDTSYDQTTEQLTLGFTTIVNWPIKVDTTQTVTLITPVGIIEIGNLVFNDSECLNVQDTYCKQVFTAVVTTANSSLCSFDGNYTLVTPMVSCRDGAPNCNEYQEKQQFGIKNSNVCGRVSTEISFTYRLAPMSEDWSHEIDPYFTVGSTARFSTVFSTGDNNVIKVTYTDISVQNENHPQYKPDGTSVWLLMAGSVMSEMGMNLNLHTNRSADGFSFNVNNIFFQLPFRGTDFYEVTASGTVDLDGNKKREVEYYKHQQKSSVPSFVSAVDMALAAQNSKIIHHNNNHHNNNDNVLNSDNVVETTPNSNNALLYVGGGSVFAGIVVLVAVVVMRKGKKSVSSPQEYSPLPQAI